MADGTVYKRVKWMFHIYLRTFMFSLFIWVDKIVKWNFAHTSTEVATPDEATDTDKAQESYCTSSNLVTGYAYYLHFTQITKIYYYNHRWAGMWVYSVLFIWLLYSKV